MVSNQVRRLAGRTALGGLRLLLGGLLVAGCATGSGGDSEIGEAFGGNSGTGSGSGGSSGGAGGGQTTTVEHCDPADPATVSCGEGACLTTVPACGPDGKPVPCTPGEPGMETCNGADDDCDGEVDEGCDCNDGDEQACYSGPPATKGVGECKEGKQTCSGGKWAACGGDVLPQAEACDGLDNDCDGNVDEGNPGGGSGCTTGQPGVCSMGTEACKGGKLGCEPAMMAAPEQCDGLDNDCDGQVDEGNPGGGMNCSTGLPGECGAGTQTCQNGSLGCVQNKQPQGESCDGLDNDCDSQIDNGNPGGGAQCQTGMLGECNVGTMKCQNGSLGCQPQNPPVTEVCGDGKDNDCDGQVDNGCGCSHDKCATGTKLVSGCDPCVTSICQADPFCCNNSWDSICVGEVQTICKSGKCAGSCPHSPCSQGPNSTPFFQGCDSPGTCVQQICAQDSYCCTFDWDSICVSEVASICFLSCN